MDYSPLMNIPDCALLKRTTFPHCPGFYSQSEGALHGVADKCLAPQSWLETPTNGFTVANKFYQ